MRRFFIATLAIARVRSAEWCRALAAAYRGTYGPELLRTREEEQQGDEEVGLPSVGAPGGGT